VGGYLKDWVAKKYLAFSGDNGLIRWFWTQSGVVAAALPPVVHPEAVRTGVADVTQGKKGIIENIGSAEPAQEV